MYDITNQASFHSLSKWLEYVKDERGNDAIIVLVANKIDCPDKAVTLEEGEAFAKENDSLFFQVSAKEGTNIHDMFKSITQHIMKSSDIINETTVRNMKEENK